jgi:uncharacterized NAD(P)/FAD-binding protein YdhS
VIGGGVSGSALAIALLKRPGCAVTLIDRDGAFGRGLAYSTSNDRHLLNVRSGRMSLFPDAPDDFVRWLAANGRPADPQGFARRCDYGAYVADALSAAERAAPQRLQRITGEVRHLRTEADWVELTLADGQPLRACAAVLALGNQPPGGPDAVGLEDLNGRYVADPWAEGALDGIGGDEEVLLVGTGLTAVDVLLALEAQGWRGHAVALSRRGLLPQAHAHHAAHVEETPPAGPGLAARLAEVRRRAKVRPWVEVMEGLRPHGQALWTQATPDERRRFLRHLRPWWDAHRHRMAAEVAEAITALRAEGRLEVVAGRLLEVAAGGEDIEARYRLRGGGATRSVRVRRVINCTGPEPDPARAQSPLLHGLLGVGTARRDPLGLGLDVDECGRLLDGEGKAQKRLFAMGPLTRGRLWEIVAAPEIRVQAQATAERLDARFGCAHAIDALFTKHPRDVGESYTEHMGVAFGVGGKMVLTGLACFVHGLVPALFTRTATNTINSLHDRIHGRRNRPEA